MTIIQRTLRDLYKEQTMNKITEASFEKTSEQRIKELEQDLANTKSRLLELRAAYYALVHTGSEMDPDTGLWFGD